MIIHPPLSILMVVKDNSLPLQSLCSYLQSIQHVTLAVKEQLPDDLGSYHVVVTADTATLPHNSDHLTQFVRSGGGLLGLVNLSEKPLPKLFGAQPTPVGPLTDTSEETETIVSG